MDTLVPAGRMGALIALSAAARRASASVDGGALSVVPAGRAVLGEVMEVEAACFESPLSHAQLAAYAARGGAFALRNADGRTVGFLLLKVQEEHLLVTRMGVRPELRGRGAGGFLLRWARVLAAELGLGRTVLHVRDSNAGAIRLYGGLGFQVTARLEGFYTHSRPEAALRMEIAA